MQMDDGGNAKRSGQQDIKAITVIGPARRGKADIKGIPTGKGKNEPDGKPKRTQDFSSRHAGANFCKYSASWLFFLGCTSKY